MNSQMADDFMAQFVSGVYGVIHQEEVDFAVSYPMLLIPILTKLSMQILVSRFNQCYNIQVMFECKRLKQPPKTVMGHGCFEKPISDYIIHVYQEEYVTPVCLDGDVTAHSMEIPNECCTSA